MLQKVLKYKTKIATVCLAVLGLALIRNFEDVLFYDPFLNFFKGILSLKPVPELIEWKLYLNLFFRYFANAILSLVIIYAFFDSKDFLKLASFLYVFFFVILILLFIVALHYFSNRFMFLFYVRRFLIQPIFLLLFVPGFYFQKYGLKKESA
jgi:exosortase F-associated protein